MTRLYTSTLTLCALLTVIVGCRGQSVITPQQAMDAVRSFEGDNTLQVTCDPLEEDLEGPEWKHERSYCVDEAQSQDSSWTVNAVTGEVISVFYRNAYSQDTAEPTGPLTQQQCQQIAEDFARAKYADFDTMGFQLDEPEWDGDGWSFYWRRENSYGARIPGYVGVDVNPVNGCIQHYGSSRLSVTMPPPQQPQITMEQAVDIAKAAKGLVSAGAADPALVADPDHTMWSFVMYGENAQGKHLVYSVEVDAITGEIVELMEPMGGAGMPAPKPSTAAGPPISLRDLAAKVPGAKVHWLGKEGARLFVGKDRYTLVPGKDTIEWTGGTIKLSQKMMLVNGRLMVPSGLLDALKSAPAPKKAPPASAKSK